MTLFNPFLSAVILVVSILLCSCNVYFDSPQPAWVTKNEKEIPKKFRGNFLSGKGLLSDNCKRENDTIRISDKRIYKSKDFDFTLSDTVLLKKVNDEYFLNVYAGEEDVWMVIRAKEERENIIFFVIQIRDSIKLNQLRNMTEYRRMPNSSEKDPDYIINPSSKEFEKILKGNFFNVGDTLVRIR